MSSAGAGAAPQASVALSESEKEPPALETTPSEPLAFRMVAAQSGPGGATTSVTLGEAHVCVMTPAQQKDFQTANWPAGPAGHN